ncbi:MAG: hypothetical protein AMXMBFR84_38580 [Candidatus Hydrogenedentota bacterium]
MRSQVATFRRIVVAFTWMVAVAPLGAFAQTAGEPLHYFVGDRTVELWLDYNELYTEPKSEAGATVPPLKSLAPHASAESAGAGNGAFLRSIAAASRADLQQQADSIAAAGYHAHAVAYPAEPLARSEMTRVVITNRLAVQLGGGTSLAGILATYPVVVVDKLAFAQDLFVLESTDSNVVSALEIANALAQSGQVTFAEPVIAKQVDKRFTPNDTFYASHQWHLNNTAQLTGATAGNDINAPAAWDDAQGDGVNIGVVDDGLEQTHEDLQANVRADLGIDFNGDDTDPSPSSTDFHGTCCAGLAAAVGNNSLGVTGVAFNAKLVGIRLISGLFTFTDEANAFTHQMSPANAANRIHISTNSWGPIDDGFGFEGPDNTSLSGLQSAVTNGRGGLGTIFTWAAGNGRTSQDNANKDGYANSRFTIAVASSQGNGVFASYSERGACLLVNTPGGASSPGLRTTTTDLTGSTNGLNSGPGGNNNYTTIMNGTSAACPIAAGVVALMLEANPNLTWRDVQHVLVESAEKNDPSNGDWFNNGAGLHFNHNYGFGRTDAEAAVNLAQTWNNVPASATPIVNSTANSIAIPDNNTTGVSQQTTVTTPGTFIVEHVEVKVNITHANVGDLDIVLTSPDGTQSFLHELCNDTTDNITNWPFMTVANWGEDSDGTWTLTVKDRRTNNTGTLNSWELKIHGYIDPSATQPVLSVLPSTRNVGPNAGSTTFDVSNTGIGTMNWTASVTQGNDWASIGSGGSGTDTGTITVNFPANPGTTTRTAQVTVTASGAAGSPKVVNIVQDGQPNLNVSPSNQNVAATANSTSFSVTNTGGGTMNWSAAVLTGGSFLSIPSGGSGTNSGTINVDVTENSTTSPRVGTIRVTSPEAVNSPIDVSVTQAGRAQLNVQQLTLNFDSNGGQIGVTISNTGAGAMTWQAVVTSGIDWLTATPPSGSAPSNVNVVAAVNGTTSPRVGTVQITGVGALNSPQTITVNQAGCTISAGPGNVQASDGTFTDRIRVTWNPVAGATQYWVYRAIDENQLSIDESQVVAVLTTTTYDDFDVEAGSTQAACGSPGGVKNYFYAITAVSVCGEGPASAFESGFRGTAKSLSSFAEQMLPASGLVQAGASVSVRLQSTAAIDPASVWGEVVSSAGTSEAVTWLPVTNSDGWVSHLPEAEWTVGESIVMTVGAIDTNGGLVGPVTSTFVVAPESDAPATVDQPESAGGTPAATLTVWSGEALPELSTGIGPIYGVGPLAPFDTPHEVWLPAPDGVDAAQLDVYYYLTTGGVPGWYPAEWVDGLLAGAVETVEIDGEVYLRVPVSHGGPLQIAAVDYSQASIAPQGGAGGLAVVALVIAVLAVTVPISRHRKRSI